MRGKFTPMLKACISVLFLAIPALCNGATLYQNTNPVNAAGIPLSPEFIYLEEVLVPTALNPSASPITVNQVTVQISLPMPTTETVSLFWSPAGNDALGTPTGPAFLTFSTVMGSPMGPVVRTVKFGNGSTTLFTTPVNTTSVPGFDLFWVGLSGSGLGALGEEDWVPASGPDFNRNQAYFFDLFTNTQGPFPASSYLAVDGAAVPEPSSLLLLGSGLLGAVGLARCRFF